MNPVNAILNLRGLNHSFFCPVEKCLDISVQGSLSALYK